MDTISLYGLMYHVYEMNGLWEGNQDVTAKLKNQKLLKNCQEEDARGLISAIKRQEVVDPILVKIKDAFRKVCDGGKKLIFWWVPSHKGVQGNEVADRLAKRGTDHNFPSNMPCTQRDIRRFLKERESAQKKKSWDAFASRNVKFFLPDITMLQSFIKAKPSCVLCQIISGHTRLVWIRKRSPTFFLTTVYMMNLGRIYGQLLNLLSSLLRRIRKH